MTLMDSQLYNVPGLILCAALFTLIGAVLVMGIWMHIVCTRLAALESRLASMEDFKVNSARQ